MNYQFTVPPNRKPKWYCGPFAICAITGEDYEAKVRPMINAIRGRRPSTGVVGMTGREVRLTLKDLGYEGWWYWDYKHEGRGIKPTLAKWLRDRPFKDDLVIIQLTRHFVVVQGSHFIDNHTEVPVHISGAPHRRARVERVMRVRKL